ncbi:hypothetical protein [Shewanella sp. YLB-07]|uniref:hypothetical protein n=1 Tax=Shewanella sp. YLB-07 TaxID=2601268 RepID=UPI00128DBA38|nr:hypothetical protein [Shewanella sp. YLB-07]MPY21590.1 hypothetical protein [Shewanella sp. YLB-07]
MIHHLSDIGILGEIKLTDKDVKLSNDFYLKKMITPSIEGIFSSRGKRYYMNLTFDELISDISNYINQYGNTAECHHSRYILLDYILNGLLRIVDTLIINNAKDEVINQVIDKALETAKLIVDYFLGKTLGPLSRLFFDVPDAIKRLQPRVYLEGDNHLLSLLFSMYTPSKDVCVGILFGGGACAAVYAAYHDVQLNYVKLSYYDDIGRSSKKLWGRQVNIDASVLLLDDNCGTGNTLLWAKDILHERYDIDAKIGAVELHWEKLLRVKGYDHQDTVFDLSQLDYLSPWTFRHHKLLNYLVNSDASPSNHKLTTIRDWANYSRTIIYLLSDLGISDIGFERAKQFYFNLDL